MSIPARYEDGVFRPLDQAWLKAAERSFEFWDNEEDAVYDNV
jgi:predicted DNA-binding antitoxin AbrB/MazE fold protein